jgi:hypothetical protein
MSDGCMQRNGKTAIMWAAERGHDAMVQMLLANGAALDQIDNASELLTYYCWVYCIAVSVHHVCSHMY